MSATRSHVVFSRSSAVLLSAKRYRRESSRFTLPRTALVDQNDAVDLRVEVDRVAGRGAAAGSTVPAVSLPNILSKLRSALGALIGVCGGEGRQTCVDLALDQPGHRSSAAFWTPMCAAGGRQPFAMLGKSHDLVVDYLAEEGRPITRCAARKALTGRRLLSVTNCCSPTHQACPWGYQPASSWSCQLRTHHQLTG